MLLANQGKASGLTDGMQQSPLLALNLDRLLRTFSNPDTIPATIVCCRRYRRSWVPSDRGNSPPSVPPSQPPRTASPWTPDAYFRSISRVCARLPVLDARSLLPCYLIPLAPEIWLPCSLFQHRLHNSDMPVCICRAFSPHVRSRTSLCGLQLPSSPGRLRGWSLPSSLNPTALTVDIAFWLMRVSTSPRARCAECRFPSSSSSLKSHRTRARTRCSAGRGTCC
ncbi:hypothetical protein B0T16DRAFT_402587 [Cercophora newfieldiana]|uniref:Uncharacterized protein n=1 Tax=Cercophora newfieldiana TaxID=92897 RepID=A0AA39YSJ6_9PEZI|nr:hypothetical protein B0T16DRAFT_402587 [Cercophora newfieldiana]